MSDKKPEKKEDQDVAKAKKKAVFSRKILIFSIMVTACVFLPSTIVLMVCMIPSFVAAVVDRQVQRTAWATVGAMNFAGTLPAWLTLLQSGHTFDGAMHVITQPAALLVAYGGAGIGMMIYTYVTPLVAGVIAGRNERRLKDIDKRQRELARKWGDEVFQG